MKFDDNFTKIGSKNDQIALKHPENEVLLFKIRFETDLKNNRPRKIPDNCSVRPDTV